MKIYKISIKNYRSCTDTEFFPSSELSTLIGPNGSGKTTILSAIRLLSSLLYMRRVRHIEEDRYASACEIKVCYDWNGKRIIHTSILDVVTNEKNEDEIVGSSQTWYMYDVIGSKRKFNVPLNVYVEVSKDFKSFAENKENHAFFIRHFFGDIKNPEMVYGAINEVVKFIQGLSYYSASQFTNPSNCPVSFEVEGELGGIRRGISIEGHKKLLYDMYQSFQRKSDLFSEFMEIVGVNGIGLVENIDFKEIKTSSSNYRVQTGGKVRKFEKTNLLVIPSFKISGNDLSPNQLSEGTFKTLALIFYLVTDNSSLLLIEEPEVCVHHGLLNSIIELIRVFSKEKQIMISTHSDSVLDKIDISSVFSVKHDGKLGTKIFNIEKNMKSDELSALKNYLENEGSLGEYWRHGDLERA